ncbi:hypothetical protein HAX54_048718 [Datura stramonium]|uniref:Uncharacterized protein n=1 Tax=Datura stramonium TaxID=4076 RepID=A0ABS8SUF1_DATST|nr:hypothetical protein [Datura stramonium]
MVTTGNTTCLTYLYTVTGMHACEGPGSKDVNIAHTRQRFNAPRQPSRDQGTQLTDNLILNTPISSNRPSSPSSTDTLDSPSSKVHSPSVVSVIPTAITHRDDNTGGQGTGMTVDSPMMAKEGTDVHPKEGSDLSTETLFEGGIMESKEEPSNILQSEAEIIKGFIIALGTREKEVGERSPSTEGSKPDFSEGNYLFVQESGEPSSQEAPLVAALPSGMKPLHYRT